MTTNLNWTAPELAKAFARLRNDKDFQLFMRFVSHEAESLDSMAIHGRSREERDAGAYGLRPLLKFLNAYETAALTVQQYETRK